MSESGLVAHLRKQDIIGPNLLTKFHEDRKINDASRVITRFYYSQMVHSKMAYHKTAPRPGGNVIPPIMTIFELVRDIYIIDVMQNCMMIREKCDFLSKTHVLTKIHEDWIKNVTSRVFTCFHYIHIEKTAPTPGGHVFSPIWTILVLVRDINKTNVLTKFHDDWAKIVTSRVFTRNTAPPPGGHLHEDWASNVTSTVFTSFEHSRGINATNVLTKLHEDRK
ncbi:hypothetical protein DPMN_080048 [Dreissena polymorpha]|uniref:Uncharacterized protein n=1 Tax=Dreissena polymorpha TaxID=45954 RepID=A0A9D4BRM6_DREPO|nr:hypothetical protein DPMN_080048 [Dreissena polymorpha]